MQASRNLEPDDGSVSLSKAKEIAVFNSDAGENQGRPREEELYIRIRRSDLERVLALVERLERLVMVILRLIGHNLVGVQVEGENKKANNHPEHPQGTTIVPFICKRTLYSR